MTPKDAIIGKFEKGKHYNPDGEFKKGSKGGGFKKGSKKVGISGRFIRQDGYEMVYCPESCHAYRNGYVLGHVFAWEQFNNKVLPKGWVVHHLNGIKSDNGSRNLLALSDRNHKHILEAKSKRIQELEALLIKQGQLV